MKAGICPPHYEPDLVDAQSQRKELLALYNFCVGSRGSIQVKNLFTQNWARTQENRLGPKKVNLKKQRNNSLMLTFPILERILFRDVDTHQNSNFCSSLRILYTEVRARFKRSKNLCICTLKHEKRCKYQPATPIWCLSLTTSKWKLHSFTLRRHYKVCLNQLSYNFQRHFVVKHN